MGSFPDLLPPGPKVPEYDFTIVYFYTEIGGKYRDLIASRLKAGMTVSLAVAGTPVSLASGYKLAAKLGLKKDRLRPEYKRIGRNVLTADEIHTLYTEKGASVGLIARRCGATKETIRRVLMSLGVPDPKGDGRRTRGFRTGPPPPRPHPAQQARISLNQRTALARWREKYGARLLPIYADHVKGMSITAACAKHGVPRITADYQFHRLQKKWLAYLDWGVKSHLKVRCTPARLAQWEWAAKQSQLNVLDWIMQTLNRESDRLDHYHARIKSRPS